MIGDESNTLHGFNTVHVGRGGGRRSFGEDDGGWVVIVLGLIKNWWSYDSHCW